MLKQMSIFLCAGMFSNIDAHNKISAQELKKNLFDAVERGSITDIEHWLGQGAHIRSTDLQDNTVLHIAVSCHPSVLEFLLNQPRSKELLYWKNRSGWLPIQIAEIKFRWNIVRLLATIMNLSEAELANLRNSTYY